MIWRPEIRVPFTSGGVEVEQGRVLMVEASDGHTVYRAQSHRTVLRIA
ncbi:hypothetical protein ACFUVV_35655 [Streptomyces sp. NPDC057376]|nr:hypothetical protein [Streptomyces sp. CB02414]